MKQVNSYSLQKLNNQEIDIEKVLNVLGNKTVRPILYQLMQRNISAQEMIHSHKMPSTSVYRHLKTLTDTGIVKKYRKKQIINNEVLWINCYRLNCKSITIKIDNAGQAILCD